MYVFSGGETATNISSAGTFCQPYLWIPSTQTFHPRLRGELVYLVYVVVVESRIDPRQRTDMRNEDDGTSLEQGRLSLLSGAFVGVGVWLAYVLMSHFRSPNLRSGVLLAVLSCMLVQSQTRSVYLSKFIASTRLSASADVQVRRYFNRPLDSHLVRHNISLAFAR